MSGISRGRPREWWTISPMTDSVSAPRIPYGAWPSPITAADVAKGQVLISYPMVTGTDVWWQEGRPEEGGRVTRGAL